MDIGKINKMVGVDEREFEYEYFHEPANLASHEYAVMDD
jgi:hypothetical protein